MQPKEEIPKNRGLKMPKEGVRKGKKPYKGKWNHQTGTNRNKITYYQSAFYRRNRVRIFQFQLFRIASAKIQPNPLYIYN